MTTMTAKGDTQKVTISLPSQVVQRMNELIPARQRSRFIAETLSERLALEEQILALDESAGAWSDARHLDMQDDAAIDLWLTTLRRSWQGAPDGAR